MNDLHQLARLGEQHARPAVNVIVGHLSPQSAHPPLLLRRWHRQRRPQGQGELVDGIRVDQQGVGQFARRPGEF